jgi:hypothetical protein
LTPEGPPQDKQGSRQVRWAAVEAVQRAPAGTPMRDTHERIVSHRASRPNRPRPVGRRHAGQAGRARNGWSGRHTGPGSMGRLGHGSTRRRSWARATVMRDPEVTRGAGAIGGGTTLASMDAGIGSTPARGPGRQPGPRQVRRGVQRDALRHRAHRRPLTYLGGGVLQGVASCAFDLHGGWSGPQRVRMILGFRGGQGIDGATGLLVRIGPKVPVHVQRHGGGGVPHARLHDLDALPRSDQRAGIYVP